MAQYDVDLRDYWRIIRKRKIAILLMVVFVSASSYGFAVIKEPVPLYKATCSVKIERATNLIGLLTGAYWTEGGNITTQAVLITSYPVLEKAVRLLEGLPPDAEGVSEPRPKTADAKISRLKAMTKAEPEVGTNIVNILTESTVPREAAEAANAVAEAFRQYNIQEKNRQTFDTRAFIEEQLRATSLRLQQAEEALRAFKESNTLVEVQGQSMASLSEMGAAEADAARLRQQKETALAQLAAIEKTQDRPEALQGAYFPEQTNTVFSELSGRLHDLLLKRRALLVDFTEKHASVIEVNGEIQGILEAIKKELRTLIANLEKSEADALGKAERLRQQTRSFPEKALEMVRLQRDVALQETLYTQLKTKHQETLIQQSGRVEEVTIIRPAMVPSQPVNLPSKMMIVATGVVLGLLLGVIYTFIAETLDTSIGTIEDVETLLGVPVLGVIPSLDQEDQAKGGSHKTSASLRSRYLLAHYDPKSLPAESFRTLRSNLQFLRMSHQAKAFLMTSSFVQEGKTFNVVNLALSLAQAGERVLLVEADLRKPIIHRMFGLGKVPGLTDYVLGNYRWQDIRNTISDIMLGDLSLEEILRTPGLDNLSILAAGTTPPNPSEILGSERFALFIKEAAQDYDVILVDAPPVLPVADATEMAPLVDGVIMVYRVGKIGRGVLKRAKSSLDNINAKVFGVILNHVKPEIGPDYFRYHTQYYYKAPEKRESGTKDKIIGWLDKLKKRVRALQTKQLIVFLLLLALIAAGLFWDDLARWVPGGRP